VSKILKRTHMCGELRKSDIGNRVVLNGWIQKRRNLGGLIFCDLRDKTGIVQILFNEDVPKSLFEKADSLRNEFVIGVKGSVRERESKNLDIRKRRLRRFILKMTMMSPRICVLNTDILT